MAQEEESKTGPILLPNSFDTYPDVGQKLNEDGNKRGNIFLSDMVRVHAYFTMITAK